MHSKQEIFRTMLLGTLLYTVVIGVFNDYTDILHTRSYSITFSLAIVLQSLTFATLYIKKLMVKRSKKFSGARAKFALVFGVWIVLFLSKFVFLWAIGAIFKESVELTGFVNIFIVVLTMTLAQKLLEYIDTKLEN
jgi:hypothetical protein